MNSIHLNLFVFLISISIAYSAGGLSERKISKLAFNTGGLFIYAEGGWNNPNECSRTDAIVLLSSDSNYDKAFALILTAYSMGKSIKGYSNDCTTHDEKTYNTIRGYKYLEVK